MHIQANVLCIWWVLCFTPSLSNLIINNQLNDDGKDAELSIVKEQKYCYTILKYQFLHYILSRLINPKWAFDLYNYQTIKSISNQSSIDVEIKISWVKCLVHKIRLRNAQLLVCIIIWRLQTFSTSRIKTDFYLTMNGLLHTIEFLLVFCKHKVICN